LALSHSSLDYYRELDKRHLNSGHHVRKIVALTEIHGEEAVAGAIADALKLHAVGSDYIANLSDGDDVDQVRDSVMGVVRSHFRPEFLNRLDEIILFHRLKRTEMSAIVDIQMKRLDKLLADRNIVLDLDSSARDWLAEKGYDPVYGARPLKRMIQKFVQDPLAEKILGGEVHDHETVTVTAGADRLLFVVGATDEVQAA